MSFRDKLIEFLTVMRLRAGVLPRQELHNKLMPERERLLRDLPYEERPFFENFFASMDSMHQVKDFDSMISKSLQFANRLDWICKAYSPDQLGESIHEKQGYFTELPMAQSLQGGNSSKYFLNPWAPFTYYAENHWAIASCINIIMSEVRKLQFHVLPVKRTSRLRQQEVYRLIKQFKIRELFERLLHHKLAYQQAVVLPKRHMLNGLMEFEVLRQNRLMPVWDLKTERLIGWDYWINYTTRFLSKDRVYSLHCPSLQHPDIAVPPAAPLAVDLEADVGASTLNNKAISQAGMLGVIIATKDYPGLTSKANARLARRLEAEIQNAHSGYLNPHSVVVSNLIEKVHKISKAGDFDASFLKYRNDIVGKGAATVYMVPAIRINVSAKSGGVYEAKGLSDKDRDMLNTTTKNFSDPIVQFLNDVILPQLNIDDFKIVLTGSAWATTADAAQASNLAAETGVPLTGNEHRMLLGAPPLPADDPKGWEYLDNSKNRDDGALPTTSMTKDPSNPLPGLMLPIDGASGQKFDAFDDDEDDGMSGAAVLARR